MAFSPSYLLPMLSFLQPGLDLRPGHDQDHGGADDGHAAEDGEGGGLVEDEDAHGDGGERFAHAQDGGQGGTDALDGQDQGQVGDDRGDDGQQQAQGQLFPSTDDLEGPGDQGIDEGHAGTEEQHPEGDAQARDAVDAGHMQARDVESVAQGRRQQQAYAQRVKAAAVITAAAAQQGHAKDGQQHGTGRDDGKFFMEEDGHDEHDHQRIQELQGGRDAARQVEQAPDHEQGGQGVEHAEQGQQAEVARGRGKTFLAQDEDEAQAYGGEEEAVKKDTVRGQAAMQQGQAEQRDETESGGGNKGKHKTHDSSP